MFKVLTLLSIALPMSAGYDLAAQQFDLKRSLCDSNVVFCGKFCSQGTFVNKCDPSTMNFKCECANMDIQNLHEFPVQSAQCQGEVQDCKSDCTNNTTCLSACKTQFACGTINAKESKLFFTNTTITTPAMVTKTISYHPQAQCVCSFVIKSL